MNAGPSKPPTWSDLRSQFALDPGTAFLDAMLIASQPRPVREATQRHLDGMNADPQSYFDTMERRGGVSNAIARLAARYLGLADPDVSGPRDIALTNSTTMGLGLIYDGLLMGAGQRVLIPECTPFFTRRSLTLRGHSEFDVGVLDDEDPSPADDIAGTRTWPRQDMVALWSDLEALDTEQIVARTLSAIGPDTRVLGLTWVSSATGLKLPVADICHAVRDLNAREGRTPRRAVLTVVDGVHGFGVEDADFDELGCDFFVAGCHKWLFGPLGTGIVCGRPDAWGWVVPTIPAFRPGTDPGKAHSPGGINAYAGQWALKEAFELHLSLGRSRVSGRTHELARALKEGLAALPGVDVITPMDHAFSAGLVCCRIQGVEASAAHRILREEWKISATVSIPDHRTEEHYLRFSPSVRNTMDEIEQAVRATAEIARGA